MNYDPRKAIRQAMMIARREVTAPSKASIKGQRHMLAYITPYEAELLMRRGGSGRLTQYGIPAFDDGDGDGDGPGGGDTSNADPGTQSAGAGNEGTGAGPTGAGIGGIGVDSQDDVGGPPGPPGGPNSGFGSSMTQDPEGTPAAANMNTAVNAQQQGYGVGIADTGGVSPTGFGAAPGIAEAFDAYDKGIIGLNQALGYAALSAFSPPGLEFGLVTDEVGNQAVGGRGNIGGAIGGIAGMASGVPGAGTVGGMIGSQVADSLGVPSQTFSLAAGGAATGGRMDPRSLPGIHLKTNHRFADGGVVQPEEEEGFDAYHGSPHEFEQFQNEKIGTGEGSQNYGYGHYVAEAEPVARGYSERLSGFKGHTYQVRVKANPEHFLDWNAPLSEQNSAIQEFAKNADISHLKSGNRSRVKMERFKNNQERSHDLLTGRDLMTALMKSYDKHDPETSMQMLSAGIPGIKYFDRDFNRPGFAPEGEGTRNYVIFDPDMIQVKRRYADGGEIMPQRDLGADPTVQQAMDVTAPFSVSNPMSVFPKPQRMWEDQRPGGAYLAMPTKEDITGHKAAQAEIGVNTGGKPFFNVSRDAVEETGSPGRGSATVKTNLFKQKAGWQWAQAPEGHEDTNTLVSINHRGKHHYALNAQFPKGVDLARYENAPSEPRLRPTTKGNVELGEQVGTITVRGKEHPVYRNAIVRNAGGAVGYADGGMPGDDPVVQQAMDVTRDHLRYGGSPEDDLYRQYMSKILRPQSEELYEAAKKVAEGYKIGDLSYSGFKQHPVMPSDVKTTISDLPNISGKKADPLSWGKFYQIAKGGTLFTLGGDRSNLGRLTHINGKELAWPVDLHAGTKYQTEPNPGVVWANDANAATALRNNILKAAEKGPVYGAFAPMNPTAVDSSRNMMDVLLSQLANTKISKSAAKKFDDLLMQGVHIYREAPGTPEKKRQKQEKAVDKMKEWPGIASAEKARDFALNKMTGAERAALVKLMDAKMWLNEGFPSVSVTRAAITDPELLHVSSNMIGGNVVELDPREVDRGNLAFEHSTYNTPTAGRLVGKLPFVERQAALPDFTQERMMDPQYVSAKTGESLLIHPYSPNPGGRSAFRGDTELRQGIQPINERMIDSIYEDAAQKKVYGFKKGGSIVDAALRMTAPDRPMFALADLFQRQLRGRPPS